MSIISFNKKNFSNCYFLVNEKAIEDLQVKYLKEEHQDLDNKIFQLENLRSPHLEFKIKLLKKQKLAIKDRIDALQNSTPDIIA